jgi:hypothetical protein
MKIGIPEPIPIGSFEQGRPSGPLHLLFQSKCENVYIPERGYGHRGGVTDPRRPWGNLRHKLEDILVIGLAALVCNGSDFEDMEDFGAYRKAELRKVLELPNGIPDESTFFRVFKRIRPEQLGRCRYEWLAGARETEGRAVNIDGKTIRGSKL